MTFDIKTRALSGFKRPRESLVADMLGRMIARIDCGHITVVLPSGDRVEHSGAQSGPSATLVLHRWRAIRRLLSHGDLGFAEAYIDGDDIKLRFCAGGLYDDKSQYRYTMQFSRSEMLELLTGAGAH